MIFSIKTLIARQIKQCYGYVLVIQFGYNSFFFYFVMNHHGNEIKQGIFQNELKILFSAEPRNCLRVQISDAVSVK